MSEDIKSSILKFMEENKELEYTIPDIQKGANIRSREHVAVALTELEKEEKVASRKKVRIKYYRLIS